MPHPYRLLLPGLLLATLLPLAARAQANFQPGYVVRPAGDTLRGEVDLRDIRFNTAECRFRPAAGAEATTYRPAEVPAYGVAGRVFRTFTAPGSTAPAFAEVLVSGPATLYQLRDAERTDHFYLGAPQFALTELKYQRLPLPGRDDYQYQPVYRLTLAQALPNCPAAERQLPQLPLTAPTLARVVQAFNACRGATTTALPVLNQPRARVGVLLGAQLIDMALVHDSFSQGSRTTTVPVPTVGSPVLGVSLSVPLSLLSRKLSAEAALFYARQRYSLTQGSNSSLSGERVDYHITQSWARLPLLLRLVVLPQARVRPVLEAGLSLNYATTLEASATATDYFQRTRTLPVFLDQRRFQVGFVGGAGVQGQYWGGRRATALMRVEGDNGWANDLIRSQATRYYLLLALDLTR